MDIILAAALVACTSNPEVCNQTEVSDGLYHLTVCDVAPKEKGAPIKFQAQLPNGTYIIDLAPKCESF